ncbi:MAG: fused MFS/spermidine synthase [Candidatus Omnitrophica bacterium]|nr:fused MFS/spermidine synthase [Candidatus Omnitrophota bacterium]
MQKEINPKRYSIFGRRILLAIIAFSSGAAIMIIELAGNRIIAPIFGNTLYTWTGLIGIILLAMSGGYYFGGWVADKKPSYLVLAHYILVAGIYTIIIPFLHKAADTYFVRTSIIWGPAIASIVLFTIPAFLLGSVTPFTVRLTSRLSEDKHVGISSGYIGMFSILGSVIGTFGTGFLLLPKIGVWEIFLATGTILSFMAMVVYLCFLSTPIKKILGAAVVFFTISLLLFLMFTSKPVPPSYILFDKTNFYHRILVFRGPTLANGDFIKTIKLDNAVEGAQYDKSHDIVLASQKYWRLAKAYCPEIKRALFLGGGSFSMPEALSSAYPGAEVEVVEIDPEVIEVGKRFFRLDNYRNVRPIAADARRYLRQSRGRYDLIFGDAYHGVRTIPPHLVTLEFFHLARQKLAEDGVYMMNIINAAEGEKAELFLSIIKTVSEVFEYVYVYAVYPNDLKRVQNIIIVACPKSQDSGSIMARNIQDSKLSRLLDTYISPEKYNPSEYPFFTDNYNPVEYILARQATRN